MSTKLSESELAEIRAWLSSYRPFRCVPENADVFERQLEVMHQSATNLLDHCTTLESELKAAQEDTNKAWEMFDRCFEIEPRAYFEKEARVNGFESPLAQAVFHLWKRETKQTVDVVAALAPVAVNNFRARLVEEVREAEWWLSLEERESAIQLIQTFELEKV